MFISTPSSFLLNFWRMCWRHFFLLNFLSSPMCILCWASTTSCRAYRLDFKKILTATISFVENSVRRKFLSAKILFGESSIRRKLLRRKFLRRKFLALVLFMNIYSISRVILTLRATFFEEFSFSRLLCAWITEILYM